MKEMIESFKREEKKKDLDYLPFNNVYLSRERVCTVDTIWD